VIAAIEDFYIPIDRVVGTSSGALAAALYANGMNAFDIATELSNKKPIELLMPSIMLNRGVFSLSGLVTHLRTLLPKDFSQLEKPLAVGVFETESGLFRLVEDGDLPSAVAASCAIPYIFQPVQGNNHLIIVIINIVIIIIIVITIVIIITIIIIVIIISLIKILLIIN
jgi:NTE family protein